METAETKRKDPRSSAALAAAVAFVLTVLALILASPSSAELSRRPVVAPVPEGSPPPPENHTACNYQEALPFLIRSNYAIRVDTSREDSRQYIRTHHKALRFRTERYGYVKGFGNELWNPAPPAIYARVTTFFGVNVRMHERVIPVLACVEDQIREVCGDPPYQPEILRGIREKNTFRNKEASNHLYGIAIDIDPSKNKCCGCGGPWAQHRACRRKVSSIFDRMSIPECWVHTFERFGFYWLGRDRMQDAMHFEFLGDPDRVAGEVLGNVSDEASSAGGEVVP
jgi:hypothetical protein